MFVMPFCPHFRVKTTYSLQKWGQTHFFGLMHSTIRKLSWFYVFMMYQLIGPTSAYLSSWGLSSSLRTIHSWLVIVTSRTLLRFWPNNFWQSAMIWWDGCRNMLDAPLWPFWPLSGPPSAPDDWFKMRLRCQGGRKGKLWWRGGLRMERRVRG